VVGPYFAFPVTFRLMISLLSLAETAPALRYLGGYLTLQDLSTLRVLQLRDVSARGNASVLEIVNGEDPKWCALPRIIIMIVLLIIVGLSPMLVKTLCKYSKLVAFDAKGKRWVGSARVMHPDSLAGVRSVSESMTVMYVSRLLYMLF
jgi:hypothetical protein